MFYIQRASAGSGKTYTLTKRFILHLIAYKSSQKWFLRSEKEIEDKMASVLAITFTNKATNEMKERIVAKLSDLAKAAEEYPITQNFIYKTDYLKDFASLTGASYQKIGQACQAALNAILNNYSHFNVSTIDSFFQEILRTFAYEVNINETYQVEIDSDFVNKSALDLTLQELDTNPRDMGNATFWMDILMKRTSAKNHRWNVFAKSENKHSIYSQIKEALKKLESEDYKSVKHKLDNYFSLPESSQKLRHLYQDLNQKAIEERSAALSELKSLFSQIDSTINDLSLPKGAVKAAFYNHKLKVESFDIDTELKFSTNQVLDEGGSILNGKFKNKYPEIEVPAKKLYKKLQIWNDLNEFPYYHAWKVYGELLPYLGLILEINKRMLEVLEENNTIKLSDTNFLLKKIIGDDETPFVYERIGNHINNFLIDEFQDTSEMQWEILRPLLTNGDANGQDSLIIGDPKQSIYRFRNAKYSLILKEAPESFHEVELLGMNQKENTNWRSLEKIVRFNNFFFRSLAKELALINNQNGSIKDIDDLYSNVVQYPHNNEGAGYVEIRFSKNTSDSEKGEEIPSDAIDFEIPELISSLKARGYRQKDIAILVSSNTKGREVINSLIEYNNNKEDKISFISEESLFISNSNAVQLIIGVLEKIADKNFVGMQAAQSDQSKKTKSIPWNQIRLNFLIYSLKNPQMNVSERIMSFLEQDIDNNVLTELLKSLQVPTLSSITEAVIEKFLSKELRQQESIYLANFQDLINEYSNKYPNDPSSFLEWWNSKGKFQSISSPAGTDAVQILTIHKSKGLEFKCVIVPWASEQLVPDDEKEEWRWVEPINPDASFEFPPFVPIKTKKTLLVSPHSEIYKSYYSQIITDKLNMYYVAFTRAKNELYVLTGKKGSKKENLTKYLELICNQEYPTDFFNTEEKQMILNPTLFGIEHENIISYGNKLTKEQILKDNQEEDCSKTIKEKVLKDYYVNTDVPKINFVSLKVNDSSEL